MKVLKPLLLGNHKLKGNIRININDTVGTRIEDFTIRQSLEGNNQFSFETAKMVRENTSDVPSNISRNDQAEKKRTVEGMPSLGGSMMNI